MSAPTRPPVRPDGAPSRPGFESIWRQLHAGGLVDGAPPGSPADGPPAPWHVRAMLAVCGWLGGLLLLVFLGLVVPDPFDERSLAVAGVLLVLAAGVLFRGKASELRAQFALSLCLAGYGAIAVAAGLWLSAAQAWAAAALAGAALAVAMPDRTARTFGVAAAFLAAEGGIRALDWPSPVAAVAAWTCTICWLAETRLAYRLGERQAPLAWGATLALWALGLASGLWSAVGMETPAGWRAVSWGLALLAALPLAFAAWRLSALAGQPARGWATGAALAVVLAGAWAQGVAFGLLTAVLGYSRGRGPLWKGGLMVALWGVGWFYYAQHWTLPRKAAMLLALGVVLLLAWRGVSRLGAREAGP
ncbi:hypothetical protein CDO44_21980 [Pigmentiphaga sp. NML080357]|uniref:DUF4401 domain-containing protein n=1 Tax=Pigmentiphaga sp. NML080357 TaxID=2008675 RepID=UPI000B40EADF|nr:DUF4401 domain-containing protein [Pigmentiphaga sp. NML080357]OVZ55829.1 hypothetical protein CDO44_21980 [Pigmentiphaga sp. NML080357]